MKKPVIAIDGTAASGKGTLAKKLAAHFGFAHLDTGLLYRYAGVEGLRRGIDIDDEAAATALTAQLAQNLKPETLDDPAYRSDEAGPAASRVAIHPGVRSHLFDLQRNFAENPPALPGGGEARGAVLDGRDIGTVVCPDADVKIYVTAEVEIRTLRRHKELQSRGNSVSYDAVLADMRTRDQRDSARATAPMKPAIDAAILDTTDLDVEQTLDAALHIIGSRISH